VTISVLVVSPASLIQVLLSVEVLSFSFSEIASSNESRSVADSSAITEFLRKRAFWAYPIEVSVMRKDRTISEIIFLV
jgi:hypothetical protein